jgi:twinkle protein
MAGTAGLSEAHASWLESRGIPRAVAIEAGLYSRNRELAFPYPSLVKWRGPDKRFWIEPAGQKLTPWLLDKASAALSDTLVWTEGEIDALSFLTAGVSHVVSVPNGAPAKLGEGAIVPASDAAFAYLWDDAQKLRLELAKFSRHILATDGDGPGQVLRDELAIRLGRSKVWYVTYPAGCKDANDVLLEHGRDGVIRLLDGARPLVPDQLVPFSQIARSTSVSFSSGWGGLDPHLQFALPEVTVISGAPNTGKSQWALALAANLARVHGMRIAILQFEDDVDRHRDDLVRYARAWQQSEGKSIELPPDAWIDRHFLTVPPPESLEEAEDKTLAWLQERIHEAATRHGCRVVIIDPWNEVEHAWGITETETSYTGKALRQIRALARAYQLLVIIVTHPSKGGGMKPAEEMTPYDIAGSAHWANKPDHVVLLHRPPDAGETLVTVAKCRDYRKRGKPGVVRMQFDPRSATFNFIGHHAR